MIILYFRFFTSESDKKKNSSDLVRKKYFQRKGRKKEFSMLLEMVDPAERLGPVLGDTAMEYRLLALPWRFLFRPRIPLSK